MAVLGFEILLNGCLDEEYNIEVESADRGASAAIIVLIEQMAL